MIHPTKYGAHLSCENMAIIRKMAAAMLDATRDVDLKAKAEKTKHDSWTK
jgi:hypothetical protein